MGTQAKMMSEGLSKVKARLNNCKAVLLFTNQTRQNVGVTYGNPTTTPGGNALKFYASIRAEIKSVGKIKKGDNILGNKTKFKTVKNKTYPPFKEIETNLMFGDGIPLERDLICLGTSANIVQKGGSWYSFGDIRLGQGEDNASEFLRENEEVRSEIEELVKGFYGI
jgi:recombination protein RecA